MKRFVNPNFILNNVTPLNISLYLRLLTEERNLKASLTVFHTRPFRNVVLCHLEIITGF